MKPGKPLESISLEHLEQVGGGLGGVRAMIAPMIPTDYVARWNSFELCLAQGGSARGCAAQSGLRPN